MVALALALPVLLKLMGSVQRLWVGAEGRLAVLSIETERPLGPMPRPWEALAQGGEELETFLDGESGSRVKLLGVKQIRIDHIFDGFNVVSRSSGGLVFDWTRLDAVVDKITLTGAKPFFSLSYMPQAISKGNIVDEPNDYSEWGLVVQKTIEHFSGEKGLEDVYYEVWNEPDLFGKWTVGGKKDYLTLYRYAAVGASRARVARNYKLGGPATTGLYKNWIERFLPYVLDNNLRLDFLSWHRYETDVNVYAGDFVSVDRWLDSHPYFSRVEKIVSESAPSSDKNSVNDSMMGGVQLLAVAREAAYKVDRVFNFSIKDPENTKGGWGVLGKPRYDALAMLNKLGQDRLAVVGEGTFVKALATEKNGVYQVLIFNYDPKGKQIEDVPVTFLNLEQRFFELSKKSLRGETLTQQIATSEPVLQTSVRMLPNTAVLVELKGLE